MQAGTNWETFETKSAEEVIAQVLDAQAERPACFTCSFQAEDVIVLDLLRRRLPDIPVLFLETGYHFAETYEFRDRIAREWKLNLVNVVPERSVLQQEAAFGILYREEPTKCCQLRKVEPLQRVLGPYEISQGCAASSRSLGRI